MTAYLLSHDLGTSGNKATLFTSDGNLVKSVTVAYATCFEQNNRVEQNPDDWWRAVCECSKALLQGVDRSKIKAVSFSGQMMGCVCIDKNGKLLRSAIIWADQRAVQQETMLAAQIPEQDFYRITGHRPSASYTLEKAMWIRDNQPELFREIWKVLNPKDYIVYRLTGKTATDYSDASGTNAFDIHSLTWSERLFDLAQIDLSLFPEAFTSTHVIGEVTTCAAEECGIPAGTAVVIGAGDGVAAAIGAACVEEGKTYNYLGSSSWISYTAEKPYFDEDRRTFNWVHAVPGKYAPTGTMQAAGNTFNFVKDMIYSGLPEREKSAVYAQIEKELAGSTCGANGLLFLPYLLGERSPRWNKHAKGSIVGLTMNSTRGEILRAAIEGVAFNLDIILKAFPVDETCDSVMVLGGLAQSRTICQILADVFDKEIRILNNTEEATSIGAALIAGVGAGVIKNFAKVTDFISVRETVFPDKGHVADYIPIKENFEACYQALKDLYEKL